MKNDEVARHVARLGPVRNAYTFLDGRPEEKIPFHQFNVDGRIILERSLNVASKCREFIYWLSDWLVSQEGVTLCEMPGSRCNGGYVACSCLLAIYFAPLRGKNMAILRNAISIIL
jgi:hypothetical protein